MMAGSRSGTGNVVTPWSSLKDGREYIVSLSIIDNPQALSILLTDKITAEEWSCQYDFKHIEDLTRRTGSYKPFEIFVSMIKNAILKNTNSVSVELYTFQELKDIKIQRHNHGLMAINEFVGSILKNGGVDNLTEDYENQNQRSGLPPWAPAPVLGTPKEVLEKRKFLIVTYDAEFDSVNYPLPLTYSGLPDPSKMQNDIKKLKLEVSQLRNANLQLREQLRNKGGRIEDNDPLSRREDRNVHDLRQASSFPVSSPASAFIHDEDEFSRNQTRTRNNENQNQGQQQAAAARRSSSNDSDNQRKVSTLLSMVSQLEDRIENQKYIFIDRIHKLETENERLSKQMKKHRRDEEMYLHKINQLQDEIRAASASWSQSRSQPQPREDNRDRDRGKYRNPTPSGDGNGRQSDRMSTQSRVSGNGNGNGNGSRRQSVSRSRTGSIVSSVPPSPSPQITPRPRPTTTACSRSHGGHTHTQARSRLRPEKEVCPRFLRERDREREQSVSPRSGDGRRTSVSASLSENKAYGRPAFDPTAYVQQKKARQLEINRQRVANIKRSLEEARRQLGGLGKPKTATANRDRQSQSQRGRSATGSPRPFQRSLSNNSRKSQRGQSQVGSESGKETYDGRSIAHERPSRSRLRRSRENLPRPRSRLTAPAGRIPFSNYDPGRYTKSRLEERARTRSLSGASGHDGQTTASTSLRSQSRSARTGSPKSRQSNRSERSLTPTPTPPPQSDIENVGRAEPADVLFGGHSHLTPRPRRSLMPTTASTDLTKKISGSNNILSHRSKTRSFLTFDEGLRLRSASTEPQVRSYNSSRETFEIPTKDRRSHTRLSRSGVRSRFDRNHDSQEQEPTPTSRPYRYHPGEIETKLNDIAHVGGNGNGYNRYADMGPGDFRSRNYSPIGALPIFSRGSGIFGIGGHGQGSAYELIPPPKPARRIDSREVD